MYVFLAGFYVNFVKKSCRRKVRPRIFALVAYIFCLKIRTNIFLNTQQLKINQ